MRWCVCAEHLTLNFLISAFLRVLRKFDGEIVLKWWTILSLHFFALTSQIENWSCRFGCLPSEKKKISINRYQSCSRPSHTSCIQELRLHQSECGCVAIASQMQRQQKAKVFYFSSVLFTSLVSHFIPIRLSQFEASANAQQNYLNYYYLNLHFELAASLSDLIAEFYWCVRCWRHGVDSHTDATDSNSYRRREIVAWRCECASDLVSTCLWL